MAHLRESKDSSLFIPWKQYIHTHTNVIRNQHYFLKLLIIILQNDIFTNVYYNHSLNIPLKGARESLHSKRRNYRLPPYFDTRTPSFDANTFQSCQMTMRRRCYVSRLRQCVISMILTEGIRRPSACL